MKITSDAFQTGEFVPTRFTCQGPNMHPPLRFSGVPEAASLVLTVEDWDGKSQPWVHWLLVHIPPEVKTLAAGTLPDGAVEGLANGGTFGYEGPCPKYFSGIHLYYFTVYALRNRLALTAEATYEAVMTAMKGRIAAKATLIGLGRGDLKD